MRRHGRRAPDLFLELAEAFVEAFAVERVDVNVDDFRQTGGLGCRELACRDCGCNGCRRCNASAGFSIGGSSTAIG